MRIETARKTQKKCPDEELAEVSDRILKKCAGVPLTIITVPGLLASKGRNKMVWYKVYISVVAEKFVLVIVRWIKILFIFYLVYKRAKKNCDRARGPYTTLLVLVWRIV
jgi:hypothetical protein